MDALNTISVVFSDNPQVVARWHEYFDLVSQVPQVNWVQAGHVQLRMLSEMARVLGYKKIDQVDLDKFYLPQGQIDRANMEERVQKEFLRVLENSAAIQTVPKPAVAALPPAAAQTNSIAP